jgi:dihydroxyacetone kinase-like protein
VFVEKIAGALADRGADLDKVAEMAEKVNAASRSFAIALTACTTPSAGRPGFDLPEDEIEIGVGIHGEPGRSRGKLKPAKELVALAMDAILNDQPLAAGDKTIVMINGLGGTPLIELYVVAAEVAAVLAAQQVHIGASLVGNYVTSLDMAGVSITVCRADDEMLDLWAAPVATAGLRWGS